MRASKVTGEVRMKRHSERLLIFNSRKKQQTHAAFNAQNELYTTSASTTMTTKSTKMKKKESHISTSHPKYEYIKCNDLVSFDSITNFISLSRSLASSCSLALAFLFHFVIGCFDELRFSFSFEQLEITKKQQTHESIMELYLHKIIFVSLLTSLSTTSFIPFLWCFLLIFFLCISLFRLHIAFIW